MYGHSHQNTHRCSCMGSCWLQLTCCGFAEHSRCKDIILEAAQEAHRVSEMHMPFLQEGCHICALPPLVSPPWQIGVACMSHFRRGPQAACMHASSL